MGQTHVYKFLSELLEHIQAGRIRPDTVITHRMTLDEAQNGYQIFSQKTDSCRKVVLFPDGLPAA